MVRSILESAGIKTGLIGTIESIVGSERIPSANTTPESYRVQELFAKMVDAGLDAVVMEVSSQALMLHRVSGFVLSLIHISCSKGVYHKNNAARKVSRLAKLVNGIA